MCTDDNNDNEPVMIVNADDHSTYPCHESIC